LVALHDGLRLAICLTLRLHETGSVVNFVLFSHSTAACGLEAFGSEEQPRLFFVYF
jgi:hypothetical protein